MSIARQMVQANHHKANLVFYSHRTTQIQELLNNNPTEISQKLKDELLDLITILDIDIQNEIADLEQLDKDLAQEMRINQEMVLKNNEKFTNMQ